MEKQLNRELAVISAVIEDGDMPSLLKAPTEMFDQFGDVLEFITSYYADNRGMPPRKVVESKFAITLAEDVGSTKHNVDELHNAYINRALRKVIRDASQKLQDGNLKSALNGIVSGASALKKDTTDIRDLDATDVEEAVAHIKRVQEMNARGVYGVQFGIPGIDDFLPSGMVPGMFGLILGYPGRGKSFLTTLMAVNAWDRNKRVLYVSLEMTESEVRARVYAIAGNGEFSLRALQRGQVDPVSFEKWANVRFDGKNEFPIVSNDSTGKFTPAALRAKIDEYSPDIVFVDYLQLMAPDAGTDGNETIKLKNLSTELKLLAMQSATPIIGVVSATPSDATDMNSIPELGQVAWSKQLAYDADWLLAVGRQDNSPIMGIAWRKNRNGPLTDFALDCNFDRGIFTYTELDFDDAE